MDLDQQQLYMSQPVDQISESSYIRINKRFLQNLNITKQMDELSDFRQESEVNSQVESEYHSSGSKQDNESQQNSEQQGQINITQNLTKSKNNLEMYELSPSYNDESSDQQVQQFLSTKKNKLYSPQQSIKRNYSNHQSFLKNSDSLFRKQKQNDFSNHTLEYYLMRKSQQKKQRQIKEISQQENYRINNGFLSPQNRFSSNNRKNGIVDFQRINYKKMLQNEIKKNKDLERRVYQLQSKLSQLNLLYEASNKDNKNLQKQLGEAQKIRKQNKRKIKNLDQKLLNLKNAYKTSYISKQAKESIEQMRKENKLLKQQNQKYRSFVTTLRESIFLLKGKKPKTLDGIWEQWKMIFESYSQNKWMKTKSTKNNFFNSTTK